MLAHMPYALTVDVHGEALMSVVYLIGRSLFAGDFQIFHRLQYFFIMLTESCEAILLQST